MRNLRLIYLCRCDGCVDRSRSVVWIMVCDMLGSWSADHARIGWRQCKWGLKLFFVHVRSTEFVIVICNCRIVPADPVDGIASGAPTQLRVVLLCFATQSLQIALQWLRQGCLVPRLHAQYYCLLQLDFVNHMYRWSGCMKAATVICQQIFSILAASDFPLKNPFKKCFKIVFFSLWRRDPVLELQFPTQLRVVLLCFATQSLQIAL